VGKKRRKGAGIDVGATGIKGAIVDLTNGNLISERVKYATPKPATPRAVADAIKNIGYDLGLKKRAIVGVGFPSVIIQGKTLTAANIDDAWVGKKAESYLSEKTGYHITLVNDADAAGMAELSFGAAGKATGMVIMLTLGTGIGSAIYYNGQLIPNTELGHMPYKRTIAEDYVSNRARKERELGYGRWAKELNVYLEHLQTMFRAELIVIGGGVSKRFDLYKEHISPGVKVVPAKLLNNAGIVGAAIYADRKRS
jgi:polyphosphate glucokinase